MPVITSTHSKAKEDVSFFAKLRLGDASIERVAPFGLASVVGLAAALLPPAPAHPSLVVIAALANLLIIVASLILPWSRLPRITWAIPPIAYIGVIALLRAADGGGSGSGYILLAVLPIAWFALYGSRVELIAAVAVLGVVMVAPIVILGEPEYGVSDWRVAVIAVAVAWILGATTHRLVALQRSGDPDLVAHPVTDRLTGLPNRRAWDAGVPRELARARREQAPLCMALVDLDHFALFNEAYGREAGDSLLARSAKAWAAQVRASDILARYGGEEFALLMPDCETEIAEQIVERVRTATPGGQTCSAGIAAWDGVEPPESLTRRADTALYMAKAAGRDRSVTST